MVRAFKVNPHAAAAGAHDSAARVGGRRQRASSRHHAKDGTDRGNALTLTGEFATGTGYADQYTGMTAGRHDAERVSAAARNAHHGDGMSSPQDLAGAAPQVGLPYTPNVDPGLVAFDQYEALHSINWQTFLVGLQYYLPPRGRVFISGNFSQGTRTTSPASITRSRRDSRGSIRWASSRRRSTRTAISSSTPRRRSGSGFRISGFSRGWWTTRPFTTTASR